MPKCLVTPLNNRRYINNFIYLSIYPKLIFILRENDTEVACILYMFICVKL